MCWNGILRLTVSPYLESIPQLHTTCNQWTKPNHWCNQGGIINSLLQWFFTCQGQFHSTTVGTQSLLLWSFSRSAWHFLDQIIKIPIPIRRTLVFIIGSRPNHLYAFGTERECCWQELMILNGMICWNCRITIIIHRKWI